MATQMNAMQRRVLRQLVRRNVQGWGRPIAFTQQRLRLGELLGGTGLVALVISLVTQSHGGNFVSQVALLIGVFLIVLTAGLLWSSLPAFLNARSHPAERITGVVNAAICDAGEHVPVPQNMGAYHFITVRLSDGKLRAFAIDPSLHDQACVKGKHITLTVVPGIEYVERVD
jgi:hypothetical protein